MRKVMGPEQWLPESWPGCSVEQGGTTLNLCPISCGRKMARGSGDLLFFEYDVAKGAMRMSSQGGLVCHKVSQMGGV